MSCDSHRRSESQLPRVRAGLSFPNKTREAARTTREQSVNHNLPTSFTVDLQCREAVGTIVNSKEAVIPTVPAPDTSPKDGARLLRAFVGYGLANWLDMPTAMDKHVADLSERLTAAARTK